MMHNLVYRKKAQFRDSILPELASICQNLAAIDDLDILGYLMQKGLPNALLTLLARSECKSVIISSSCLDGLLNLVNLCEDQDQIDFCMSQIQNFTWNGKSSLDYIEQLATNEFEEVAEKASEIIEIFFYEMDPDNWLDLEERTEIENAINDQSSELETNASTNLQFSTKSNPDAEPNPPV